MIYFDTCKQLDAVLPTDKKTRSILLREQRGMHIAYAWK
jgi:hypothetical protein